MEIRAHDLSINDMGGHDGIKESFYVDFPSVWRGEDVIVTVCASRYTHSSGLSEWQICGDKVRRGGTDAWTSNTYSDTARQRLTDRFRDDMAAFLKSEDYVKSETRAYYYELRGKVMAARPHSDDPTRNERRLTTLYSFKLGQANYDFLVAMCDAYDTFVRKTNRQPVERS